MKVYGTKANVTTKGDYDNAYKAAEVRGLMDRNEVLLTRREVEARLAKVGDYVKMDYLARCLKQPMDFDTKKFVLVRLATIYESRRMFLEAGKMIRSAAEINVTFEGKMNDFMKSTELFVKAGAYDEADISFSRAVACASDRQKDGIKVQRKEMFSAQAEEYMKKDKRQAAMVAYERLLSFDLDSEERRNVQTTLAGLYQKLGKIREYYSITRA